MIRVVVWNENIHEKNMPEVAKLHPKGIHGTIADILGAETDFTVRTATLDDPDCGLTEEVLKETDVLFWWGHAGHQLVPDEVVERVYRHVLNGMGMVVLHSGHHSKIFKKLNGTPCDLAWHDDSRERIFTVKPSHPIAKNVPAHFEISYEECYSEPFSIAEPEELIFIGWYNTGEVFRSGFTFHRGNGRIFYFQPGHETAPAYYVPEVRQIIKNGARWAANSYRVEDYANDLWERENFKEPIEKV